MDLKPHQESSPKKGQTSTSRNDFQISNSYYFRGTSYCPPNFRGVQKSQTLQNHQRTQPSELEAFSSLFSMLFLAFSSVPDHSKYTFLICLNISSNRFKYKQIQSISFSYTQKGSFCSHRIFQYALQYIFSKWCLLLSFFYNILIFFHFYF